MRILMVGGDTSIVRGQRGPFYNTLTEFSRYWDAVDILTRHVPGVSRFPCFENVTFYPAPHPSKWRFPQFVAKKGWQLADKYDYNLLVTHDYGAFLHSVAAVRLGQQVGLPVVSEIHHIEGYPRSANLRETMSLLVAQLYLRWAAGRVAGVRLTNDWQLRPLLTGWGVPSEKLKVLHSLYLDFEVFYPQPATPRQYDVVWVGRLVANKAPQLAVAGVVKAAQQLGRPIHLALVGSGPMQAQLLAEMERNAEFVTFTHFPWIDSPAELAEVYRQSRVLLCTSFSEGGPRVVGEALACGTPVITTRVGLGAEMVQPGVNGELIDWQAADLADRLAALLSDEPRQAAYQAAAPAAVAQFEKARVIRAYAEGLQTWATPL